MERGGLLVGLGHEGLVVGLLGLRTVAGLGLFLVHSLVRQLRGRVTVRGRQPAVGTIFEVELPAAP